MSESEHAARLSWTMGSICQVHAPRGSMNKLKTINSRLKGEIPAQDTWLIAQIVNIEKETDSLCEWLTIHVKYHGRRMKKKFLRNSPKIRPSIFPSFVREIVPPTSNQSYHVITKKRNQLPVDLQYTELVVFGFLRSLELATSRVMCKNTMKMCRQFYTSDLIGDTWPEVDGHLNVYPRAVSIAHHSPRDEFWRDVWMPVIALRSVYRTAVTWKLLISHFEELYPDDGCGLFIGVYRFTQREIIVSSSCTVYDNSGFFSGLGSDGYATRYSNRVNGDTEANKLRQGTRRRYFKWNQATSRRLRSGDIVEVHLDLKSGHLSFSVNGQYLGVAFDDIDCTESYRLVVCMRGADAKICMGFCHNVLREWDLWKQ